MLVIEVNMANTSIVPLQIGEFPYDNSWQGNNLGVAVQHLNPMIIKVELLLARLDSLQWEWAFRAAHVYT
jgi:hypothetical protein